MATNTPIVSRINTPNQRDELNENAKFAAVAEGISTVGEAAIEEGVTRRVGSLKSELLAEQDEWVSETLDALSDEGELASDIVQDVLGAEGIDESTPEPVRAVLARMAKLKVAESQGALSSTELKMRQEVILRQYMARNPALTPQFQAAAQDVLGYNPIGAQIDAIVGAIESKEDYEDKQLEDFIQISKELGVDQSLRFYDNKQWVTNTVARMQQAQQLQTLDTKFKILDTQKGLDAQQVVDGIRENAAGLLYATQGQVTKLLENVLGADPEMWSDIASAGVLDEVRTQLEALKSQTAAEFKAAYPNAKITGDQLNDALAPVLAYITYAQSEVGTEKFSQKLNAYVSMAEQGIYYANPDLTRIRAFSRAFEFLPETTLTATAQGRDFTQQAAQIVSELWGHEKVGRPPLYNADTTGLSNWGRRGTFMYDPQAKPEDNAKTLKGTMSRALTMVRSLKKDAVTEDEFINAAQVPVAAMVGALGAYEEYLDDTGTVMSPDTTRSMFEMSSGDDFREFMAVASPSDRELLADQMTRAINAERVVVLREAVNSYNKFAGAAVRTGKTVPNYGEFFGSSFKTPNVQIDGQDASAEHFLAWDLDGEGNVTFSVDHEALRQAGGDEVSVETINKLVNSLNQKSSPRLTKLIRSYAHIAGGRDYESAAELVLNQFDTLLGRMINGG